MDRANTEGFAGMSALLRLADRLFNERYVVSARTGDGLSSMFGPLELSVLEVLWSRSGALNVRALQRDFPDVAYTTLMTTLDRLYKKSILSRRKSGRAFYYEPRWNREEVNSNLASAIFIKLLGGYAGARLLLSTFVDAVGQRDELLLNELEELLQRRRAEMRAQAPGRDAAGGIGK